MAPTRRQSSGSCQHKQWERCWESELRKHAAVVLACCDCCAAACRTDRRLFGCFVCPYKKTLHVVRNIRLEPTGLHPGAPRLRRQASLILSCSAHSACYCSRHRLEASINHAVNALSTAWRRLQLLQEAVLDQGAALTNEQLAKEREQIVGIRDRLKQAQVCGSPVSCSGLRQTCEALMR